jgi:release factor glutamine methyltransferase
MSCDDARLRSWGFTSEETADSLCWRWWWQIAASSTSMVGFHQLPTSSDPAESPQWIEWNEQAVDRARRFAEQQQMQRANAEEGQERSLLATLLKHLTYRDYENIYEPSDDTYLLLDALQYEVQQLQQQKEELPLICLEIGCGTGVVSAALSVYLRQQQRRLSSSQQRSESLTTTTPASDTVAVSLATDVNPHAVTSAQRLGVEAILCDLGAAIRPGIVDLLIFNPPYVVTPDDEVYNVVVPTGGPSSSSSSPSLLSAAWAGGTDGRVVIDRFVTETLVTTLARPYGVCYLVTVDDNRPYQLAEYLLSSTTTNRMIMRPLFRRQARNEFLTVQKITWEQPPQGEEEEIEE